MAKIHTLKISNYKGIKKFEYIFGFTDFICLIGRGDSGKTSILEAISLVLSPSWMLTFYDTDFHNCDVRDSIEIEATLYNIPDKLIDESKFGLYIRGIDPSTNIIHDDLAEEHVPALTIKLIVERDLEPKWFVVNERQEPVEVRASDRASLNVFMVSDYIDRHFTWSKGNPLYSLLKEEMGDEKTTVLIEAFRGAKEHIDTEPFNHLDGVTKRIITSGASLGVNLDNAGTTIDFRDISLRDDKISLHDEKVPFRLKGKGTKRLISIAIQLELVKEGGILLIDEIEQGLEPDRVQHLVQALKGKVEGQIFITTHSRDVLVELDATNIFKAKRSAEKLFQLNAALQPCVRANPEAFFSERVLVCEGPTEVGICRAVNLYRSVNGLKNASQLGIRLADGRGSNMIDYSLGFQAAEYDVCLFCDSDIKTVNEMKPDLKAKGIRIVDFQQDFSTEKQVFADLPKDGIAKLLAYRIEIKSEESVRDSIKSKYGEGFPDDWKNADTEEFRKACAAAAVIPRNEWFKRTDYGQVLGAVICEHLDAMKDKTLGKSIEGIFKWMDNA